MPRWPSTYCGFSVRRRVEHPHVAEARHLERLHERGAVRDQADHAAERRERVAVVLLLVRRLEHGRPVPGRSTEHAGLAPAEPDRRRRARSAATRRPPSRASAHAPRAARRPGSRGGRSARARARRRTCRAARGRARARSPARTAAARRRSRSGADQRRAADVRLAHVEPDDPRAPHSSARWANQPSLQPRSSTRRVRPGGGERRRARPARSSRRASRGCSAARSPRARPRRSGVSCHGYIHGSGERSSASSGADERPRQPVVTRGGGGP